MFLRNKLKAVCIISESGLNHLSEYCFHAIGFCVALPRSPKSHSLFDRSNRLLLLGVLGKAETNPTA